LEVVMQQNRTNIEVIRELPMSPAGAAQVLVRGEDGRHFVVSSVHAMFSGFETLVFPADEQGEVTSWLEVAGGRGASRNDALEELAFNYDEAVAEAERNEA